MLKIILWSTENKAVEPFPGITTSKWWNLATRVYQVVIIVGVHTDQIDQDKVIGVRDSQQAPIVVAIYHLSTSEMKVLKFLIWWLSTRTEIARKSGWIKTHWTKCSWIADKGAKHHHMLGALVANPWDLEAQWVMDQALEKKQRKSSEMKTTLLTRKF